MDADLVREVAEEVKASSSTYVDYKIDVVDGSLEDTIAAVLAVLERRGMEGEAAVTAPRTIESFIQWKGTDVCIDIYCDCGTSLHFDGDFCYAVRCWQCKSVWRLPSTLALEASDDEAVIQDTEPHQGEEEQ